MKIASARIPRRFLLVFSIIFAGMPLPSQLTIQARSTLPASKKELNPESGATQRPVPTQIQAGLADMSPQADWRFQVEEGKSKREAIALDHGCPTPKLFRIKSDKRFLKFEVPTDSVLFKSGQNKFSVQIDAAGLKVGVYSVKLSVECLDCKEKPKCPQVANKFIVEVTVTKQSSSPLQGNPQNAPSPPAGGNYQGTQVDKEAQELSMNGPQFPATLNLSDLKFKAFVVGNSPLFLDYELEQPGHVILLITVKKKLPYIYMFPETSPGRHEKLIKLPAYLGGSPSVSSYSIKAVSERMFGLVPLVIHAFAVGEEAVGSSGLDRVSFEPRNVKVVRGLPDRNATYSFRAVRPFSGGANADIRRINGSSATSVSAQPFSRRIERDETITGVWDCKRGRTPSLGKHKLFVKAWFTVQNGGSSAFAFSPSLVDIQ